MYSRSNPTTRHPSATRPSAQPWRPVKRSIARGFEYAALISLADSNWRGCESALDWPADFEPVSQRLPGDTDPIGPFSNRERFTLECDDAISSLPISCLLLWIGPSAITRLIVAVRIDSIDRMLECGLRTHVGKKVHKLQPSLADGYPLALVEVIVGTLWAAPHTPSHHRQPRSMFRRFGYAVLS